MLRWILRQLRAANGRVITFREATELLQADLQERRRHDELIGQAKHDLMEALRRRKLTTYGKRDLRRGEANAAAEYKPIPHTLFLDELVSLTDWDTAGPDPEHPTALFKYRGPTFRHVKFYASDVLELWPSQPRIDAVAKTMVAQGQLIEQPSSEPRVVRSTQQRMAIANKPGGGGKKVSEATAAMISVVKAGRITLEAFRRMKQKELVQFYPQASRTTLTQARVNALAELKRAGYPDIAPT